MALKPSISLISRRIALAVQKAAAAQSLASDDYTLIGSYDPETEQISLTLGTDHPIDERRLYADTLGEIRRAFPESPQFAMMHVGLVIRKVAKLDDAYT